MPAVSCLELPQEHTCQKDPGEGEKEQWVSYMTVTLCSDSGVFHLNLILSYLLPHFVIELNTYDR